MASTGRCMFLLFLCLQFLVLMLYLSFGEYAAIVSGLTVFVNTRAINETTGNSRTTKTNHAINDSPQSTRSALVFLETSQTSKGPSNIGRNNQKENQHNIVSSVSTSNFPDRSDAKKYGKDSKPSSESSTAFQPIDNKQAWIYSAFYDHVAAGKGRPVVRMFGLAENKYLTNMTCIFSQGDQQYNSSGQINRLRHWDWKPHAATYLGCDLPKGARPTHVSVTFNSSTPATNRLLIQYPGPRTRNFTVCYSVLHSGYNKDTMLIENIEMNRILGADHFYVYNYSISPRIDKILQQYQQEGLVSVFPWPLPRTDVGYFAQMTAINDCIYRNRNVSRLLKRKH